MVMRKVLSAAGVAALAFVAQPAVKTLTAAEPAAAVQAEKNLEVEFATVVLKMAKVDLQQALDFNRRVSGAYSEAEVERLRNVVKSAEEQVDFAKNTGDKPGAMNLFGAEAALRNAEGNLKKAQETNAQAPGAINETSLEKLRLTAELARLNVAKGRAAVDSGEPLALVQWQLETLRIELWQLRNRLEAITSRR